MIAAARSASFVPKTCRKLLRNRRKYCPVQNHCAFLQKPDALCLSRNCRLSTVVTVYLPENALLTDAPERNGFHHRPFQGVVLRHNLILTSGSSQYLSSDQTSSEVWERASITGCMFNAAPALSRRNLASIPTSST